MSTKIEDAVILLGGIVAAAVVISFLENQVGLSAEAMVAGSGPKPHSPTLHPGQVVKIFGGIPDIPRPGHRYERNLPSAPRLGTGHYRA